MHPSMRAVGFTRYGGPDALRTVCVPEPPLDAGQIRIQVQAATINPADVLFLSGGLEAVIMGPLPYVAGLELAGTVVEVGPEMTWSVGDQVMAMTKVIPDGRGAHAETVVVSGDSAAPIPVNADAVEAATVPMNGLTAQLALRRLGLHPGQSLVVTGAAGAVGGYAVQLAARTGIVVIAVGAPGDAPFLRSAGAAVAVDRDDDVAAAVRRVRPDGVDAAIDGALLGAEIEPAVRDGGTIIALRPHAGDPPRGIVAETISVRDFLHAREELEHLRRLVEAGRLTLRVAQTYTPARAADGFRAVADGGTRGRHVLVF